VFGDEQDCNATGATGAVGATGATGAGQLAPVALLFTQDPIFPELQDGIFGFGASSAVQVWYPLNGVAHAVGVGAVGVGATGVGVELHAACAAVSAAA
jgi:hypothetical protein